MQRMEQAPDELVRVFVAVALNDEVRKNLAEEQARLRCRVGGVKWTPLDTLHLTLVFLGDVFAGQIDDIVRVLDRETAAIPAFDFEVAGLGTFGPVRSPRVVWAGVGRGSDGAGQLQSRIAGGLRELNLTFENRPFNPHLTLGRIKFSRDARGLEKALATPLMSSYGVVRVDRVLLMRSVLRPAGPEYTCLHESPVLCPLPFTG